MSLIRLNSDGYVLDNLGQLPIGGMIRNQYGMLLRALSKLLRK